MKKILSLALCLAMLFTMLTAIPVSAELATTEIDSKTYYKIGTAEDYLEFVALANADLTINAILTADIDLSGKEIVPIGTYKGSGAGSLRYSGTFDGNGHVITNLSVSKEFSAVADNGFAMFSSTNGAVIKNLGLENAKIENTGAKDGVVMGGLIAAAYGTAVEGCYIKNSTVLSTQANNYITYAAPLLGYMDAKSTVTNCYSTGNTAGFSTAGGTANGGTSVSSFVGCVATAGTAANIVNSYARGNTLSNLPDNQKRTGFARKGTSGNTTIVWTNSYTDLLAGFDSTSKMGFYETDSTEWATLAGTLGEAFKADTQSVNGGAPRLSWESEPGIYTITVDGSITGGSVTAPAEAANGASVSLIVTPDTGYQIDWVRVNGNEIKAPYSFTMPSGNATVTAQFMLPYTVTVTESDNGTVTAPEKAFRGEEVSLTVTPDTGYVTEWVRIDGEAVEEPYTFTMPDKNVTVTAQFKEIPEGELVTTVIDQKTYYRIYTADNYKKFVELANTDLTINAILMADIDLDGWTGVQIGKYANARADSLRYSGTFDGNGHVIRNLSISRTFSAVADNGFAMFSATDGAVIKNLGLENAKIENKGAKDGVVMAVIVGAAYATTIENCYVKNSSVLSTQPKNYINYAAPIGGFLNGESKVINCYSTGNTVGFSTSGGTASGGASISCFVGCVSSTGGSAENIVRSYAHNNTLLNVPSGQKSVGFARLGYSGNTTTAWLNSYTDKKTGFDAGTSMNYYETDAPEWSDGTVLAGINGDSAFKADTYAVNGGVPTLKWEKEPVIYSITVDSSITGGTVASAMTAAEGATVALSIVPDEGYKIDWVKVNGEEISAPYTKFIMPSSDVIVTAAFMSPHNISVINTEHGSVTVPEKAFRGDTVKIDIIPDDKYVLDKVLLNGEEISPDETDGVYRFTMPNTDIELEVQLVPAYSIAITPPENGTVTASKALSLKGETVELTVTADDGYKIDWVRVNGSEISAPYSFTMPDSDVSVEAKFMPPYTITKTNSNGGSVTVPEKAFRGETVQISPSPDRGYAVEWVKVGGNEIKSPYSFTMPQSDVSVEVKFITQAELYNRSYVKSDADEALKYITDNCTVSYITKDVKLLTDPSYKSTITYKSSNEKLMTNTGVIYRPKGSDGKVTLTVSVERKAEIEGKEVTFTEERKVDFIIKQETAVSSSGGGGGSSGGSGGMSAVVTGSGITMPKINDTPPQAGDKKAVFSDIQGHWAREYIEELYNDGIISGKTESEFSPDENITREEFITVFVKALGFELVPSRSKFTDVSDNDWFAPYVITAFENNIVNGISTDKFGVFEDVSRQDMCVIVHNAMKDLLQDGTKEKRFSDDYKISDYAKTAVYSLKESGIVSGRGENEFEPLGTATRAEAARIICSIMEAIVK